MPAVDRPRREGAGARGANNAAEQLENLVGEQQEATAARAATALEKLRRKHEIAAARENKQAQLTAKARERAEQKAEAKRLAKEQEEAKAAEKDARRVQKERERAMREEAQEEAREVSAAAARDALLPSSASPPGRTSSKEKVVELLQEARAPRSASFRCPSPPQSFVAIVHLHSQGASRTRTVVRND